MTNQNHVIKKQSVEVKFYKQKENFYLHQKVAALMKDKLTPALENLFDTKTSATKLIKIDTLDIDLGNVGAKNWEEEFVKQAIKKIKYRLEEIESMTSINEDYQVEYLNDKPRINKLQSGMNETEALKYFIKYGSLPWNFKKINIHELLEIVVAKSKRSPVVELKKILIEAILFSPASFQRFLLQFEEEEIDNFLQQLFSYHSSIDDIKINIDIPKERKKILSVLLLFAFQNEDEIFSQAKKIFNQFFSHTEKQKILMEENVITTMLSALEIPSIKKENIKILLSKLFDEEPVKIASLQIKKTSEENIYFIENAGIVLLHPFLQPLFKTIEILKENIFIDVESQRKAVLLSQFLITGNTDIPEHTLILNKILCGYNLQEAVEAKLNLKPHEEAEVNAMLDSVIEYWTALKTTSIKGLRNSFLRREGKLTEFDEYWLLQVEQKSFDVLMNFLPWGIGIIKLPWMKKRLMVEWNS